MQKMNTFLLAGALIALVAVGLQAQDRTKPIDPQKTMAPQNPVLTPAATPTENPQYHKDCFELVGPESFDFGTIDPNTPVVHTFVYKNNCSETVNLDKPRASCGCTAAMLSESVIPPGGEAKIEVKFTPPGGTRGNVTKTVSVYFKGQNQPHQIIRFSAKVRTDIEINPQNITLLGAEVGKEVSGKFTLKNVSDKVIEVTDVPLFITEYADTSTTGTAQAVAMQLETGKISEKKFTVQPNETKELTVTVTPKHNGQLSGSVQLKTGKGDYHVQLFGIVRPKTSEVRK